MTKKDPLDISGIEEIRLVEPSDWISRHAKMRAEAMRRRAEYDAAQALENSFKRGRPSAMHYGAGLTERDVADRKETGRRAFNPYFLLPVAAALVAFFAWDWVKDLVGRVL